MNQDQTTPVRYTWEGHLLEAEHREEKTVVLGGGTSLVCAEFIEREDGSLDVNVVSNGPQTRHGLSRLVNLLQSLVVQDAIEGHAEAQQQEPDGE